MFERRLRFYCKLPAERSISAAPEEQTERPVRCPASTQVTDWVKLKLRSCPELTFSCLMIQPVLLNKSTLDKNRREFQWTHPLVSVWCYDVAFFDVNGLKLKHLRTVFSPSHIKDRFQKSRGKILTCTHETQMADGRGLKDAQKGSTVLQIRLKELQKRHQ